MAKKRQKMVKNRCILVVGSPLSRKIGANEGFGTQVGIGKRKIGVGNWRAPLGSHYHGYRKLAQELARWKLEHYQA